MSSTTPTPSTHAGADGKTLLQDDAQAATLTAVTTAGQPAAETSGVVLSVIAFCLAAIAIFFVPIVFGVAGAILGGVARKRGEKLGTAAMWTAIGCTIAGLVLGAVVVALTYIG